MRKWHIPAMITVVIALFGLLLIVGCDEGFSYHPDGWNPQGKKGGWKKEWSDLSIRTWRILGLNGSDAISVEFEITNKTEMTLDLQSAELVAKGRSYFPSLWNGQGKNSSGRTIQPKMVRRLPVKFSLGGQSPVPVILGPRPHIVLSFREGSQSKKISIPYVSR
jgi:hypothetical protein